MYMARRKMTAEEAWRILWDAPRENSRLLKPIAVLKDHGCGKKTAIELIRELTQQKVLLPHCTGESWDTIVAVRMDEGPPRKRHVPSPAPKKRGRPRKAVPSPEPSGRESLSPYQRPVSRVAILVDRDNMMIPIERTLKRSFPFAGVLAWAAQNGGA